MEEDFIYAAEFGDIPTVQRILDENPSLNVDFNDILGRTPLRLAVGNEHLEVCITLWQIWPHESLFVSGEGVELRCKIQYRTWSVVHKSGSVRFTENNSNMHCSFLLVTF